MDNQSQKSKRQETLKKNYNRFKQSKIGMTGLIIVIIFGFLALLQPFLFLTGIWDYKTYDPVVGYDAQPYLAEIVECPKDYPTERYEERKDCPGKGEITLISIKPYKPDAKVYDIPVKKYKIKKEEIVFLSANTWDVSGGGNYGYRSIWVNRNNSIFDNLDYVPKKEVKNLNQLLDIV